MPNQNQAYLLGLTAVLLWSTVASAFKLSLGHLDPLPLLFYACCFSMVVLGTVLVARGESRLIIRLTPTRFLQSAALGFLNPFLYYLVLFKAYDLLPAQEAQPLNYTWALTLALLSVPILGHRLSLRQLIAGLISYSGVWVIATRGQIFSLEFSNPTGVLLALGSTVLWALYWLLNTRGQESAAATLFLNFVFGLPWIALACLLFSSFEIPHWGGLLGAAYIGCFEMGITFLVWLLALRRAENAGKVGTLIFLSPFLSLLFIHLIVGEEIMPSTLPGLVLIILGLILQRSRS